MRTILQLRGTAARRSGGAGGGRALTSALAGHTGTRWPTGGTFGLPRLAPPALARRSSPSPPPRAEYKSLEKQIVDTKRAARAKGDFFVEPQAKLGIVIRIRGINGVSPKIRRILQLLRLRQINNATFVRLNKATLQMLQLVTPYIAWGYPNLKTVRELVYKRGFGKIAKQRVALTDNALIERELNAAKLKLKDGSAGIVCMEDLIHEIVTVGPSFQQANNFLWPFKLSAAKGGMEDKLRNFVEGGHTGNREQYINELVKRMI